MNWKVLFAGALIVVPLIVFLALGFGKDPRAVPTVMEGRPAPTFALKDMNTGEEIGLADLRGQVVVVNFWSSWCVPCAQEHPWLVRISRDYLPRGVVFLGVLYGDEPAKGKGFLKRYGENYPTLIDDADRTAIDYGVAGVPETFIIDGEGRIVKKFVGPVIPDEFISILESLL